MSGIEGEIVFQVLAAADGAKLEWTVGSEYYTLYVNPGAIDATEISEFLRKKFRDHPKAWDNILVNLPWIYSDFSDPVSALRAAPVVLRAVADAAPDTPITVSGLLVESTETRFFWEVLPLLPASVTSVEIGICAPEPPPPQVWAALPGLKEVQIFQGECQTYVRPSE